MDTKNLIIIGLTVLIGCCLIFAGASYFITNNQDDNVTHETINATNSTNNDTNTTSDNVSENSKNTNNDNNKVVNKKDNTNPTKTANSNDNSEDEDVVSVDEWTGEGQNGYHTYKTVEYKDGSMKSWQDGKPYTEPDKI